MTVLHVNEHLSHKGGVETYLLALLPRLEDRGVSTAVAYGRGDPSLHTSAHAVATIGQAGFSVQRTARTQMEDVLGTVVPDVIHVHNVQNVGILQACLAYGPTVVTTHDYRWVCPANSFFYENSQSICQRTCGPGCFPTTLIEHCMSRRPAYGAYYYYRAKWSIARSHRFAQVVVPSEGARNKYVVSGFEQAAMKVLPYFCDLVPRPTPRPLPDRPTITFLGRIAPNKGHEYFVDALGKLPDTVQGVMVGSLSDDDRYRLRERAARGGSADRLVLRGWARRDEVLDLFDHTSVFIFPSLWPETLGIVGIEALSRGVPVVASDVGGVREWCRDGETGYTVPPGDAAAIADRVHHLLSDTGRLRAFGRRGIDLIRTRFLPEHHTDTLLDIYDRACAAHATESVTG